MRTVVITLSVDELRVAAAVLDAAVPGLVEQYATAELGADAAAARSLVARELATPGADEPLAIELGPLLVAVLGPLCAPDSVLELELDAGRAATLRCAEIRDAAGQVRVLRETSPDIWCLDEQPVVADALATVQPLAAGDGGVVELGLAEHAKLEELLVDERHDDVRTLLAARGSFLAQAFTDPSRTLGRLTRVSRQGDAIVLEGIAWVSAPCGTWVIVDADPDDELASTTFTPVEPAGLAADIDAVLTGESS
ncbi:MAG: hypothetical protein DLM57_17105 [Pseudonocardiales bacterium]|nr:MAG: hypothetical protein DLM57_17105 [Pseudonocardiales bacterium]